MFLTRLWRRRRASGKGNRIEQFRSVLTAARGHAVYRRRIAAADDVNNIDQLLNTIQPITASEYTLQFKRPHGADTRSLLIVPYAQARAGLDHGQRGNRDSEDLYSVAGAAKATADLFRLSRFLATPANIDWQSDHALVVFTGIDTGVLTESRRDQLWREYQVPIFEHFLGTDGLVIASECEAHCGLHLRRDRAIFECVDDELLITSLTDRETPALRVRTGMSATLDDEPCDCGRAEPRLTYVAEMPRSRAIAAVA